MPRHAPHGPYPSSCCQFIPLAIPNSKNASHIQPGSQGADHHHSMYDPATPPQVSFNHIVSFCRPARDDEDFVMRSFASHASRCYRCADPYRTYKVNNTLCDRGHAYARDIRQYIYAETGQLFSVTDAQTGARVQVEVPAGYKAVRGLFKAINEGLKVEGISEAKEGPVIQSQDTHHVRAKRRPKADMSKRPRRDQKETRHIEGRDETYQGKGRDGRQRASRRPGVILFLVGLGLAQALQVHP